VKQPGKVLMVLCFMGMGVAAVVSGLDWPFRAALFPVSIGSIFVLLSGMELYLLLWGKEEAKKGAATDFQLSDDIDPEEARRRTVATFLWIIGFFVLIGGLGFPYAIPVYVLLFLKVKGKEGWGVSLGLTVIAWASFYGLFVWLLKVNFQDGWFQQGLRALGAGI
jgi:hypothetical protein